MAWLYCSQDSCAGRLRPVPGFNHYFRPVETPDSVMQIGGTATMISSRYPPIMAVVGLIIGVFLGARRKKSSSQLGVLNGRRKYCTAQRIPLALANRHSRRKMLHRTSRNGCARIANVEYIRPTTYILRGSRGNCAGIIPARTALKQRM